jgi:hypothetical protein
MDRTRRHSLSRISFRKHSNSNPP